VDKLGWDKSNLGPFGEFMPLEVPNGSFSYCFLPCVYIKQNYKSWDLILNSWREYVYSIGVEETKGKISVKSFRIT